MFQQIEMIRNARCAHVEGIADFADSEIAFAEHFQNAPAGRITESFEEEVQMFV